MTKGKLTVNGIAQRVTQSEGLTESVTHGNVREIIGIISDMIFNDTYGDQNINGIEGKEGIVRLLYENGKARDRRRK